jgi:hypothetical protein
MKKYLLLFLLSPTIKLLAQVPEDAIRLSWFPQNGSARSIAIGGAMGSLGGDISATFVNPAGLGFYKTREVVFTPGLFLNNLNANYRDNSTTSKKNNFGIGPSGFVVGTPDRFNSRNSHA